MRRVFHVYHIAAVALALVGCSSPPAASGPPDVTVVVAPGDPDVVDTPPKGPPPSNVLVDCSCPGSGFFHPCDEPCPDVATETCLDDEGCPDGFECRAVVQSVPDVVFVCVPVLGLGAACANDAQCEQVCRVVCDYAICTQACDDVQFGCPSGFECVEINRDDQQCIPKGMPCRLP